MRISVLDNLIARLEIPHHNGRGLAGRDDTLEEVVVQRSDHGFFVGLLKEFHRARAPEIDSLQHNKVPCSVDEMLQRGVVAHECGGVVGQHEALGVVGLQAGLVFEVPHFDHVMCVRAANIGNETE